MHLKELNRTDQGLAILWQSGKRTCLPWKALRLHCSCSTCREQKVPHSFSASLMARMTAVRGLGLVGNYALGLTWGDGHRSLYALDELAQLSNGFFAHPEADL